MKFLLLSFTLLFSFNAGAVVKQSVSNALSYSNIVETSSVRHKKKSNKNKATKPALKKVPEPVMDTLPTKTADLTNADSVKITLKEDSYIEIKLKERPNHSWKIQPSSPKVQLLSNEVVGSSRILKYKVTTNPKDFTYFIYFDIYNSKGHIKESKELTITSSI